MKSLSYIFNKAATVVFFFPFSALFTSELLRQEQAKLNEARKISVVNVNPTNIRPHSDTPEIRKYKKRFNSEILCAALWGIHFIIHVNSRNEVCMIKREGRRKKYFCSEDNRI